MEQVTYMPNKTTISRPPEYRRTGFFDLIAQTAGVEAATISTVRVDLKMNDQQALDAMAVLMEGLVEAYRDRDLARQVVMQRLGLTRET